MRGKRFEERKHVLRSPSTLREEHEKLKIRPWSFVQVREPVLGEDQRREGEEVRGLKSERNVHRCPFAVLR